MSTAAEIEQRLEDAIAMARRMGFRVAPGGWGIHATRLQINDGPKADEYTWQPEDPVEPCLCPMACVIMGATARHPLSSEGEAAAAKLGLKVHEVSNFIIGFDSIQSAIEGAKLEGDEFYELGKKMRVKVMTENGVLP